MSAFLLLLSAVVLASGGAASYAVFSGAKLRRRSWQELVLMLQPVSVEGIEQVAFDYLHPGKGQLRLQAAEVWQLVGGLAGLQAMYNNSRILCALAASAEQWNFEEAVIVTERIRREAAAVRWAVLQIEARHLLGFRQKARIPFYVHEAASAYHLMRSRLLALYETSHAGRRPALAGAL